MEIKILSDHISSKELKQCVDSLPKEGAEYQLRQKSLGVRGIDPTILVAVISTTGASLVALLTTVLSIAKEKQLSKIIVQSKDGTKIEIPANYSVDKLDAIIKKIKEIETEKILISK